MGKFEVVESLSIPGVEFTSTRADGTTRKFHTRRRKRGGLISEIEKNPEIADEICQYLRDGTTVADACALVGVPKRTFHTWMTNGKKDLRAGEQTAFAMFAVEVEGAMAEAKHQAVSAVLRAAENPAFWQAGAWFLERRYPDEYGKQDRLNLNHSGGVASIGVNLSEALQNPETRAEMAGVVNVIAKLTTGGNVTTGDGDDDDQWQDQSAEAFDFIE
jgi:transposase